MASKLIASEILTQSQYGLAPWAIDSEPIWAQGTWVKRDKVE